MRKAVIGITANVLSESGSLPSIQKSAVNHDYIQAIERAGGIPVLLPVVASETAQCQLDCVDGLLLSGGYDVDPILYGEQPLEKLGYVDCERDQHELALVRAAWALNMPILGICRGIQLLNVAFGGTLYQDISLFSKTVIKHMQQTPKCAVSHSIAITPNTRLSRIMGRPSIITNSFHHQAVKTVAPDFIINAMSQDGVIEGIESNSQAFIIGVQWHPELMAEGQHSMAELFNAFVQAAKH